MRPRTRMGWRFGVGWCCLGAFALAEAGSATTRDPVEPIYLDRSGRATRVLGTSLNASELVGSPVTNLDWTQVARVEQVMIDPEDGRVSLVVLSFAGQDMPVAVPWSALSVKDKRRIHLTLPEEELRAAPRLHTHGGTPEIFGSSEGNPTVRVESSSSVDGVITNDHAVRSAAQGPSMQTFAPRETVPFDPHRTGWLRGIIVGKIVAPLETSSDQVVLLVEAGGETWRVDLAPQWYLVRAELSPTAGEPIELLGSRVTDEEPPVLVAMEVTTSGRTLRLRSDDGTPLWRPERR